MIWFRMNCLVRLFRLNVSLMKRMRLLEPMQPGLFAASVYTTDLNRSMRVMGRKLKFGTV